MSDSVPPDTMLRDECGKAFRCSCGCNVFREDRDQSALAAGETRYRCNACSARYVASQAVQRRRTATSRDSAALGHQRERLELAPTRRCLLRHRRTGETLVASRLNPHGYGSEVLTGDDTMSIEEFDVRIGGWWWIPLKEAFRLKLVIPQNEDREFGYSLTEEEMTRGYYY